MYRQSTNGYIADLMKILISQNEKARRASDALSKAHTLYTAGQIMDRRARLANIASLVSCGMLPGAMWKREREARLRSNAKYSFNILMEDEMSRTSFSKKENSGNYYTKKEVNPDRITPEMVTSLKENEIFVFGSNIYGIHSGGASACAFQSFGAINGQAEGLQGQSYAIPTDGVSLKELYAAICRFHQFATDHPELTFFVTRIGCGTAGWSVYNIAPMFANCAKLDNVKLPKEFWDYL